MSIWKETYSAFRVRPVNDQSLPNGATGTMATIMTVVFSAILYYGAFGWLTFEPGAFQFDLVPFYCGGEVILGGGDPYRVEPLRTCEHAVTHVSSKNRPATIPAPQPPYVLGVMALFHPVPYGALRIIWIAFQVAAFIWTVKLCKSLFGISSWIVWSVLGMSDLYCSLILGQLLPFCILGLLLTARGVARSEKRSIVGGLLLASVEPHIAVGSFATLILLGKPTQRASALVAAAALSVISLAAAPFPILREYIVEVLPLHALAEVNNQDQVSATYALHAMGLSPSAALTLAKFQFALLLLLGVSTAGPASRKYGAAMLPLVSPALAVVGGPFLHITQICAAIPAALGIYAFNRNSSRGAYTLVLLSIPWLNFQTLLTVLPLVTASVAALFRWVIGLAPRSTWLMAGGITLIEGIVSFHVALENITRFPSYGRVLPSDFAEGTWKAIMDLKQHSHIVEANIAKLPTLVGLSLTLVALTAPLLAEAKRNRAPRLVSEEAIANA